MTQNERVVGEGSLFRRVRWTDPGKFVCAAAIVVAQTVATSLLLPHNASEGYAVYEALFAGIAFWFGRRAGFWAVGLGALLVAYYLLPGEGFAVADPTEALGLVAFVGAGLFIVSIMGAPAPRLRFGRRRVVLAGAANTGDAAALLAELSHRVGNDLNVLTCVAELQSINASTDEARQALSSIADRIQIFGNVYRRLSVDLATTTALDMRLFLNDLCADLRAAHLTLRPISLEVRSDECEMPATRAMLVGLIMNEAVTNSLKYAFPDGRTGAIRIVFGHADQEPGALHLTITDDGVGMGGGEEPKGTGIGQRLMQAMAAQLNGSYALERRDGHTVARLRFPAAG